MKRYANGEAVTKERIQDEPWYSDYQAMMEVCVYGGDWTEEEFEEMERKALAGTMTPEDSLSIKDTNELIRKFIAREEKYGGSCDLPKEQIRRWADAVVKGACCEIVEES